MLITDALTDLGVTNIAMKLDTKAKKAALTCEYSGTKEAIIKVFLKTYILAEKSIRLFSNKVAMTIRSA